MGVLNIVIAKDLNKYAFLKPFEQHDCKKLNKSRNFYYVQVFALILIERNNDNWQIIHIRPIPGKVIFPYECIALKSFCVMCSLRQSAFSTLKKLAHFHDMKFLMVNYHYTLVKKNWNIWNNYHVYRLHFAEFVPLCNTCKSACPSPIHIYHIFHKYAIYTGLKKIKTLSTKHARPLW